MRPVSALPLLLALLSAPVLAHSAAQSSAEAQANEAPQAAAVVEAVEVLLPDDIDADALFDGKQTGSFAPRTVEMLPKSRKVAVPGFRVAFTTYSKIQAVKQGGYFLGRETSGAKSTTEVSLDGVDAAAMQAVADAAYQTFVRQLQATGRELVPVEQMQPFIDRFEKTRSTPEAPYTPKLKGGYAESRVAVFSPSALPLWWTHGEQTFGDKSPFSLGNYKVLNELTAATGALVVVPTLMLDFAKLEGSGRRGFFNPNDSAETSAALAMSVPVFEATVLRADEVRMGNITKGETGQLRFREGQGVVADVDFAEIRVAEEKDNSSLVGAFAALGLNAGRVSARSRQVASSDNARYSAAAQTTLARATGGFAKLFAKYPAQ